VSDAALAELRSLSWQAGRVDALVIGHDHVAGIEHLGEELAGRGYELTWWQAVPEQRFCDPDVAVAFPAAAGWDLVVTLGAPWPRDQIAGWAGREVEFLADVRAAGSAVVGICFGAQLLAESLGAPAVALPAPRIGWRSVTPRAPGVAAGPWFQWHADQLTAPVGAEVLAESVDGVEVFRVRRCVGVQFHPEMTPRLLERWLSLPGGPPRGLDLSRHCTPTRRGTLPRLRGPRANCSTSSIRQRTDDMETFLSSGHGEAASDGVRRGW